MSWEGNAMWSARDESQYRFLEQKYADRQKLGDEAEAARKLADKSQTIDGKPNPHHPMLALKADMAQQRFEIAYMVERNARVAEHIETLEYLHQRVSILEGAYGHMKMLAEKCRIDYALISDALNFVHKFKKEHHHDKESTSPAG